MKVSTSLTDWADNFDVTLEKRGKHSLIRLLRKASVTILNIRDRKEISDNRRHRTYEEIRSMKRHFNNIIDRQKELSVKQSRQIAYLAQRVKELEKT